VDPERLSAWISGDVSERDTAVVRAHVESCPDCTKIAGELRTQVLATRGLDRPEPPPTLWSAIEGALDAPTRRAWSWRATLIGALAGAAAVVVLTGGLGRLRDAWTGSRSAAGEGQRHGQGPGPGPGPGQILAGDADPLLAEAERELERAAVSYEQAVNRLRKILDYEKTLWDPETRARVDDRLARLDEAVDHSRAVARRDPGDSAGADMLFSAYRRQIDFLAEAVHRGSPATAEGFR
jgi:hypothetical protein